MNRPQVKTRRLVLKPLSAADYEKWRDSLVNALPTRNRWDAGPKNDKFCSKKEFRKIILRHRHKASSDDYYWFGVFHRQSGKLIGHIDFDIFLRSTHQFANFGYQIYNRYWGRGFGQEAALAGIKIGFRHLKLHRLEAAINLDNRKSIRLVRAIGMRREGIKKQYWFENGKWVDHLIYVANPEDFGIRSIKPF